MTFRDDLLDVVDGARSLLGPSELDQRPTQVTILRRVWTGGRVGQGDPVDTVVVELAQFYRVQDVGPKLAEQITGSGGRYAPGEVVKVVVTPKTPSGAGYTKEELEPAADQKGEEIVYLLSGGVDGEFKRVGFKTDRAYRYELFLQKSNRTP